MTENRRGRKLGPSVYPARRMISGRDRQDRAFLFAPGLLPLPDGRATAFVSSLWFNGKIPCVSLADVGDLAFCFERTGVPPALFFMRLAKKRKAGG